MGKINEEAKRRYFERIKEYKGTIDQILKREASLLQVIRKESTDNESRRLTLAEENMNMVSYLVLMNALSVTLLGVRNEAFLNDARKGCYKSIIYLEEAVTPLIDVPFSDYEEHLQRLASFDDASRYRLVRKLGLAIQSVVDDFGDNSKWKWSFVELGGRYAIVTKNLLNLKTLVAGMDPRVPGYEERTAHLTLVKRLLQQAADGYRQKYELSTLRIDDFKLAISYLSALRRVHMVLSEAEDADSLRKKVEVWRAKMETDLRKREQGAREDKSNPQPKR